MANLLTSNPIFIDTAASSTVTNKKIQQIQWIEDNADIVDDDDLVFVINEVTITVKMQKTTDVGYQDTVIYQAGPFNIPIYARTFSVTTIDHGTLLVWVV